MLSRRKTEGESTKSVLLEFRRKPPHGVCGRRNGIASVLLCGMRKEQGRGQERGCEGQGAERRRHETDDGRASRQRGETRDPGQVALQFLRREFKEGILGSDAEGCGEAVRRVDGN